MIVLLKDRNVYSVILNGLMVIFEIITEDVKLYCRYNI
jgi:hypothetical protein